MKTNIQNQTRGCIGEEFDLNSPAASYIATRLQICRTAGCDAAAGPNGIYCLKCYEQRQAFYDAPEYHASQYDWRWLYVPCAAAIALIALLWWLWPKLIALRMGDGQP